MAFDLDTARVYAKIAVGDTSQDLLLTMGMNAALAIAENYCDRFFLRKRESADFIDPPGPRLQIKRYPLINVQYVGGVDGASPISGDHFRVHHIHGYVQFGNQYSHEGEYRGYWRSLRTIRVTYEGGYDLDELPADLELALWGIFNVVWQTLNPNAAGGAVTTVAPGAISSISIPDVGTVSFAQGGAASGTSAVVAGSAAFSQYGPFFHLLDGYRDLPA